MRVAEAESQLELESTHRVGRLGKTRDVGIVGDSESKRGVLDKDIQHHGVALAESHTATQSEGVLALIVDKPPDIKAIEETVVGILPFIQHDREQCHRRATEPLCACVNVPTGIEVGIVETEEGNIGSVEVAARDAEAERKRGAAIVVPSQACAQLEIVSGVGGESLGGVEEAEVGHIVARLTIAKFKSSRKKMRRRRRDKSRDDGIGGGRTIVEAAGTVAVGKKAHVDTRSAITFAVDGQFGGEGQGAIRTADRSPLVAVGKAEARLAVKKTGISGVEEDRIEIGQRGMDILSDSTKRRHGRQQSAEKAQQRRTE